MKNEFITSDEIIKEVAEELDLPITTVKSVYNELIRYIKFLVKETDKVSLKLYKIGNFHIKTEDVEKELRLIKSRIAKFGFSDYLFKKLKVYKGKHKKLLEFEKRKEKTVRKDNIHLKKKRIENEFFIGNEGLEMNLQKQNNRYNEYKEKI